MGARTRAPAQVYHGTADLWIHGSLNAAEDGHTRSGNFAGGAPGEVCTLGYKVPRRHARAAPKVDCCVGHVLRPIKQVARVRLEQLRVVLVLLDLLFDSLSPLPPNSYSDAYACF